MSCNKDLKFAKGVPAALWTGTMKLKLWGKIISVIKDIDCLLYIQIGVGGQYSEKHTTILEKLTIIAV